MDAFPLLYPASRGVFFPLNSIFLDAKNNKAHNYGFTNILDACYDGAVPGIAAPANAALCANPDQYIYWVRPEGECVMSVQNLQPLRQHCDPVPAFLHLPMPRCARI